MTDTYPLRYAISKALDIFADRRKHLTEQEKNSIVFFCGDTAVEEFAQYLLDEIKALDGQGTPEPECEGCRHGYLALYVDEDGRCTKCGKKRPTFREPGEETLLACQGAMDAERSAERAAVLRYINKVASEEHNRGGPVALLTRTANAIERAEHRYDMAVESSSTAFCDDGPKADSCSDGSLVR